jgi:integrase/recombinase XerD
MTKRKAVKKRAGRKAQWERPSERALGRDTLGWWAKQYAQYLRERNYSERTLELREVHLSNFAAWCETRELYFPMEITRAILERYQSLLYHHRRTDGRALSFGAQASRLVSLKMYFRWLARQRVVALSPASEMELPRVVTQLPRTVLTALEAEAVLRVPDVDDVLGLRDRAMLEVLYATAMRRAELVHLRIYDVDRERCTMMIREGKGRRDRVVPLGERTLLWVEKYLAESRPELAAAIDDGTLFLANMGEALSLDHVTSVVRRYVERSNIGKRGACHLFRHTAATLMLENGADIRFIQQLLGHAKLDTTSIYTRVSIHKLREVHALTHPGARLKPAASMDAVEVTSMLEGLHVLADHPTLAASSRGAGDAAQVLQVLLDAEAEREDDELVRCDDGGSL